MQLSFFGRLSCRALVEAGWRWLDRIIKTLKSELLERAHIDGSQFDVILIFWALFESLTENTGLIAA